LLYAYLTGIGSRVEGTGTLHVAFLTVTVVEVDVSIHIRRLAGHGVAAAGTVDVVIEQVVVLRLTRRVVLVVLGLAVDSLNGLLIQKWRDLQRHRLIDAQTRCPEVQVVGGTKHLSENAIQEDM